MDRVGCTPRFDLMEYIIEHGDGTRGCAASLDTAEAMPCDGVAIEARIFAEDPTRDFAVSKGEIRGVEWPHHPSVFVSTWLDVGATVEHEKQALLARVVVWGEDKPGAMYRLQYAMQRISVLGIRCNLKFLQSVANCDLSLHGIGQRSDSRDSGESDASGRRSSRSLSNASDESHDAFADQVGHDGSFSSVLSPKGSYDSLTGSFPTSSDGLLMVKSRRSYSDTDLLRWGSMELSSSPFAACSPNTTLKKVKWSKNLVKEHILEKQISELDRLRLSMSSANLAAQDDEMKSSDSGSGSTIPVPPKAITELERLRLSLTRSSV